jgi:peptidoglycan/xylan/chitin deacetylase (PgdA/CDA1 family)
MRSARPTGGTRRRGLRILDRLRGALPPSARRAVRRGVNPLLRPIGSINGAKTSERVVALTFDDGPDPLWTPRILEVLASHDVSATFFVLLERAQAHPSIVGRALEEGHEVALHGVDHRRLVGLSGTAAREHLLAGREVLEAMVGSRVAYLRPPFGAQSIRSYGAARRVGLDVVVWSADAEDWIDQTPTECAARGRAGLEPGGILLLHDGFAPEYGSDEPPPSLERAAALDLLLSGMAEDGYRATSVGKLLSTFPARRTAWFRV